MSIEGLAPQDRLTWMVGGVARADVFLEARLRSLLADLDPAVPPPKMIGGVIERCREILPTVIENRDVIQAATAALDAAAVAHEVRNRYVHDLLLKEGLRFTRLNLRQVAKHTVERVEELREPFQDEDIEQCLLELRRVRWRIQMLSMIVRAVDPTDRSFDLAVVNNRFEMNRSGNEISVIDDTED